MSFRSSSDCCWIPEGEMGPWNSRQTRFMLNNGSSRCWCGGRSWCLSRTVENVAWLLCDFFKTMLFIVETEQILALCSFNKPPGEPPATFSLSDHRPVVVLPKLISITCCDSGFSPTPPPSTTRLFSFPGRLLAAGPRAARTGLCRSRRRFPNRACEMRSRWLPRPPKADSLPQHHGLESHTPQDQR